MCAPLISSFARETHKLTQNSFLADTTIIDEFTRQCSGHDTPNIVVCFSKFSNNFIKLHNSICVFVLMGLVVDSGVAKFASLEGAKRVWPGEGGAKGCDQNEEGQNGVVHGGQLRN